MSNDLLFTLSKKHFEIRVYQNRFSITGSFWYLKNKEFIRCKGHDEALISNFTGMGYLSKRSPRKCMIFVLVATLLQLIKFVLDKISDILDKLNNWLNLAHMEISMPPWCQNLLNISAVICLILAIVYFFSKMNVIEISFTDKRFCIPRRSIDSNEFGKLYNILSSSSKSF